MKINGNYMAAANMSPDMIMEEKETSKVDITKVSGTNSAYKRDKTENSQENGFMDYIGELRNSKEEEKIEEEVKEQKDVSKTVDRMTEEDYLALEEEGMSIEKYNLERLDRMLSRVKEQREFKDESIVRQKEKLREKEEDTKKLSNTYGANKEIVEKLEKANLPVTEANIEKLANAWEMVSGSMDLSDQATAYIVKNGLELTIENIYKAKYSSIQNPTTIIQNSDWNNLKEQVKGIIQSAGLEDTDSNMGNARWLIENQLPVNEKSLWTMVDISKIKQEITPNMVYERGAKAIANGQAIEDASLSMINEERVNNVLSVIDTITDEAIHNVLEKDGDYLQVSISTLKNSQKLLKNGEPKAHNGKDLREYENEKRNSASLEDLDIKTISVRRQLEEIRLKLTVESGAKLIKNGISIETESLSKIVDELKALEDSYYKNLLKEGNVEVSESNTSLLKSSLLGMEELKSMPSYILGTTLSQRQSITSNNLLEAGHNYKLKSAEETYETLMTKPRADLGDSIKKAFANVDDILKDLNLEINEANQRAVRILGYNSMEINHESIRQVKAYDQEVNHMMKNFHPAVAIELIREGINPLEIPITELNQKLDSIKEELGVTEEERFSKFLWKMDKNKNITKEERKSFLGIYRLLNSVEKTDGAALGAVMKANQEVSMKNLLTAVQSKKNKNMDYSIDDSFGALSEYITKEEGVINQINTAFTNSLNETTGQDYGEEQVTYMKQLVSDIKEMIQPEILAEVDISDIMNMPVETFYDKVSNFELDSSLVEYYKEQLEQLSELCRAKTETTDFLKNLELPVTVANLFAAKDYLSKENHVFSKLNKALLDAGSNGTENSVEDVFDLDSISDSLIESLVDKDSMVKEYDSIKENWESIWDTQIPEKVFTVSDVRLPKQIGYGISLVSQMANRESYEIPIKVGENITNVNVTILKNVGESGKSSISMESSELGKVLAAVNIKNGEANIFITSDTRNGYETLQSNKDKLIDSLLSQEFKIKQINYGMGNQIKENSRYTNHNTNNEGSDEEKVDTNTLYLLTKAVLIHMKEVELSSSQS